MTKSRPYRGPEDAEQMKELLISARARIGHGCWHVGDLVWRLFLHSIRYELAQTLRLWVDEVGKLVGFAIVSPPTGTGTVCFELQVHPQMRDQDLESQMLDWIEAYGHSALEDASGAPQLGLSAEPGIYEDDLGQIAALQARGFQVSGPEAVLLHRSLAQPIPKPLLPEGFVVRPVGGPHEAKKRAGAHRDAFHPSRLSDEAYLRLMRTPGYVLELDLVAVASDGTHAAFCLGWLDATNKVGEFEPVGTRSAFRRAGLARAVLLDGLHRMKSRGAVGVVVGPISVDDGPALQLYSSVGFHPVLRNRLYALKPATGCQD